MFKTKEGIWINGGLSLNGKLGDMWFYDIIQRTWKEKYAYGDVPDPFYDAGFDDFEFRGIKYFVIGCFGTATTSATNDLYMFDPLLLNWYKLNNAGKLKPDGTSHGVPNVNKSCNIKYDNGFIYQWGGTGPTNGVYRYDIALLGWEKLESTGEPATQSFFGSTIKDGAWIVFPGWDGVHNTDKIYRATLPVSGSNSTTWSEIPVTKDEAFLETVFLDAYAFAHIEPYVYFHGGYSELHHQGNFISRINVNL